MPRSVTQVRIFVASPGDVEKERDALDEVVEDLQHSLGDERGLDLAVVRWERDTYPAMGRTQGIVNNQVGDYDVFVGLMWKRFGTPTGQAGSGTEEEFNRAYERWQQTGQPPILFYFCERGVYLRSEEERKQFDKVLAFRDRLEGSGLIGTYETVEEFKREVRRALARTIRRDVLPDASASDTAAPDETSPQSRIAKPSKPEPPAPRFTNIPLPQRRPQVTDLDKRRFIRDGFATLVAYFEDAADALRQSDSSFDVELEKETTRSLLCEICESGQHRSGCRIWITDHLGSESIAYASGVGLGSYSGNRMNDFAGIEETENGLTFALSGMDFQTQQGHLVDAEGLAEHFWRRLTRPLDRRGSQTAFR